MLLQIRVWRRPLVRIRQLQPSHYFSAGAGLSSSHATSHQQPAWLQQLLQDQSPGPKLYAWTLENLPGGQHEDTKKTKTVEKGGSSRRIYVLGIGNLGRLYASCLARMPDRPPITLIVHRKSLLEHWRDHPGVTVTHAGVPERTTDFAIEWWTEEKPPVGPVREAAAPASEGDVVGKGVIPNLLVATKAPDAVPQVDRLRRYLGETSTVAFVQNGMNRLWPPYGADYSAARYPPSRHPNWLVCVTTHGVFSDGPFSSVFASPADVAMGLVLANKQVGGARYLIEEIKRSPELVAREVSRPSLLVLQLEKLVINSVINSMTALLRCKNGVLFEEPEGDIVKVIDLLIEEASAVLRCLIQDQSTKEVLSDTLGEEGFTREALLERFSASRLRDLVHRVGEKVKENTSSMAQDVMAGKKTEIREINGWLVDTAKYLSGNDVLLDVPSHSTLMDLIESGTALKKSQLREHFPTIRLR